MDSMDIMSNMDTDFVSILPIPSFQQDPKF